MTPASWDLFRDPRAASATPATVAFAALVRVPVGTVLLEEIGFRAVVYGLARGLPGAALHWSVNAFGYVAAYLVSIGDAETSGRST